MSEKMEVSYRLEKIFVCLSVIKVKWLHEPNDDSVLSTHYEFEKANAGMDLFMELYEVGYALYKKKHSFVQTN